MPRETLINSGHASPALSARRSRRAGDGKLVAGRGVAARRGEAAEPPLVFITSTPGPTLNRSEHLKLANPSTNGFPVLHAWQPTAARSFPIDFRRCQTSATSRAEPKALPEFV